MALVKDQKFYSFSDNSYPHQLFADFALELAKKISKKNSEGDNCSKETFAERMINAAYNLDTRIHLEIMMDLQEENSSKYYIKIVDKYDLERDEETDELLFLQEEGKNIHSRIKRYITEEEATKILLYFFIKDSIIDKVYGKEKWFANKNRTAGALFFEGQQPEGWEECTPNDMLTDDIDY